MGDIRVPGEAMTLEQYKRRSAAGTEPRTQDARREPASGRMAYGADMSWSSEFGPTPRERPERRKGGDDD